MTTRMVDKNKAQAILAIVSVMTEDPFDGHCLLIAAMMELFNQCKKDEANKKQFADAVYHMINNSTERVVEEDETMQ